MLPPRQSGGRCGRITCPIGRERPECAVPGGALRSGLSVSGRSPPGASVAESDIGLMDAKRRRARYEEHIGLCRCRLRGRAAALAGLRGEDYGGQGTGRWPISGGRTEESTRLTGGVAGCSPIGYGSPGSVSSDGSGAFAPQSRAASMRGRGRKTTRGSDRTVPGSPGLVQAQRKGPRGCTPLGWGLGWR
jgi:hypothetical protein